MENRGIKFYFTLFFCLSSIKFFSPAIGPPSLVYYIYYSIFIITTIIVMVSYKSSHYNAFSRPVLLILIAEIIAALNATYSWNQNLFDSLTAILPFMSYILFFLLIVWEFSGKEIEKLIVFLGGTFIIVYLISFLIFPTILFGSMDEFGNTRGFQRIRTEGIGFLFLLGFFSLSQYILKRKFLWLIIYSLSMICIIMSLTRTYIVFSFLFSAIFILKNSSLLTKIMAVLIVAFCFYIVTKMNFYKLLVAETDSQVSYVKDDIRVKSAKYYLTDFSPNLFSKIFGNGQKNTNKNTRYANFVDYLEEACQFYTADLGYIGLYIKFGILAILSYFILVYKTLKTSVSTHNLYCKYFLIFIFTISLIIDAPFNSSFIPSIMLALYILSSQSGNNDETLHKNQIKFRILG